MSNQQQRYHDYLKSEHWSRFKAEKEKVEKKECLACQSSLNVQLHHMKYRTPLEDAELDDTCWLCPDCHKSFHEKVGVQFSFDVPYYMLRVATVRAILTPSRKIFLVKPSKQKHITKAQRKTLPPPEGGWLKISIAEQDKLRVGNGFSRATMNKWGVAFPAKKGWRKKLVQGRNPNV